MAPGDSMALSPLRVRALGPIAADAIVWRLRAGREASLRVSVAVKATFALVPGGTARLTAPVDLARNDVSFERDPSQSLQHASDLVPYRPMADVTFLGHAYAPPGRVVPAMSVRLAVYRGTALVDRTLHVIGDRAPGEAQPAPFARMPIRYERAARSDDNPFGRAQPNLIDATDPARPGAFGPIARRGAVSSAGVLEVPRDEAWEPWQSAPAAQRTGYLRGDEWIVLDGLHPALARVQTQLPGARGVARAFVEGTSRDVELHADTLSIDGDAQTCCVVWRGRFAISAEAVLPTLSIAAGLELPGQPVVWPEAPEVALPQAMTAPARLASTAGIDDDAIAALARGGVMPFSPDAPSALAPSTSPVGSARPPAQLSGTAGLSFGEHLSVAQRPATPFDAPPAPPPPMVAEAPAPEPPPAVKPESPRPPRPPAEVPPRRTPSIPVFHRTPFVLVTMPWQVSPPRDSLTVFVKGTFDLVPGAPARARAEAELPIGDVHEDGNPDRGLVYSTDFALHKPKADVLLTGKAYRGSMGIAEVGFRFGHADNRFERRIAVFGERTWQSSFGVSSPSVPKAFDVMPLVWERAFGGARSDDNPLGIGLAGSPGEPARLPNLEDPLRVLTSPRDTPPPVCFAPIPPSWRERRSKLGTYDRRWVEGRWPYFPEDFEWSFFQAAPRAQQLAYLAGDEPYEITGMRRDLPALRGSLPGVRVRVVVAETKEAGGGLREVTMRLDTASFDVEELKLTLVWRGVIEVSGDEAPEIGALLLAKEEMASPKGTLGEVRDACFAPELRGAEVAPAQPANDEGAALDPEEARIKADLDARLAAARAEVEKAGWRPPDPGAEPPEVALPDPAAIGATLRGAGMDAREVAGVEEVLRAAKAATAEAGAAKGSDVRARVTAKLEAREPLDGVDLTGADLSGLDLGGRSLQGARLLRARLDGCNLAGADLSGAQLGEASLAKAIFDGANLAGADLHGADLRGASFEGASIEGASFASARGEGARFGGAKGASASFADGDWTGARFDACALPSADFSRAKIDGVSFARATLSEVRLYDAHGAGVCFDGAHLAEARGDDARLPEATFLGADAARSIWENATLDRAILRGAKLPQASFVRASCAAAVFSAADLTGSRWARARLPDAELVKANLVQATFERADLSRADLRGANLYRAETWKVKLDGAKLDGAIVGETKVEGRA